MALTDNQKELLTNSGTLAGLLLGFSPADAAEGEQLFITSMKAAQDGLAGAKPNPITLVKTGLQIGKGIAHEFNNPKAVKFADDLMNTGEDALDQHYGAVAIDLIKDFQDLKAIVKK